MNAHGLSLGQALMDACKFPGAHPDVVTTLAEALLACPFRIDNRNSWRGGAYPAQFRSIHVLRIA